MNPYLPHDPESPTERQFYKDLDLYQKIMDRKLKAPVYLVRKRSLKKINFNGS